MTHDPTTHDPTTHDTAVSHGGHGAPLLRQLGRDTAYVLVGLPLAMLTFTLAVSGLALGAGLLITVAGLPVLAATLHLARGFATLERARVGTVVHRTVVHRPPAAEIYRRTPPGAGWWRRTVTLLTDGQVWLDVLHAIARLPVSLATFTVAITWWCTAAAGLTYWFWHRWLPSGPDHTDLAELLGLGEAATTRVWFHSALGITFAATLPWVMRLCALSEAALGRGLLIRVAELRQRGIGSQREAMILGRGH